MIGWRRTGVLGMLAVPALLVGGVPPAAGATSFSFEAGASADGAAVNVIVPAGVLTNDVVDTSSISAQAHLTSSETSTGFAAIPNPGDLVLAAPGLLSFATGHSLPGYPMAVQTSYPTQQSAEQSAGAVVLQAASTLDASKGSAVFGTEQAGRTLATADVVASSQVVATANSSAERFAAGPVTVGKVISTAVAPRDAAGKLTVETTTEVTGLSVAGMAVGVTPGGLVVPGTEVPLPDSSPVRDLLATTGTTLTLMAPQESEVGVASSALVIETSQNAPGVTSGRVRYVLGRAEASVTLGGINDSTSSELDLTGFDSAAGGSGDALTSGNAAPALGLGGGFGAGDTSLNPVAAPAPITAEQPAAPVALRRAGPPLPVAFTGFYLVVAAAALAAAVAATMVRFLGVKLV